MRNYLLIFTLMAWGCNSNQQQANQKIRVGVDDNCFVYPKSVDSLQLRDLYDSARWSIYTWHCDEYYKSKSDTSTYITFGELPLKFDNLTFKHDTLELSFNFMDKQQSILPSMTRDTKELNTGVGFDIKTRAKIYMLSPNGYSSTIRGGANRYENPLQPEVLTYIKSNWNKLDSCFKELAERKRITK